MSTAPTTWVRNLVIVYGATLGLWLAGFAYVAYAESLTGYNGSFFGTSGTAIMAVFGLGPVYLAFRAIRMLKQSVEAQRLSAEHIFAIQQVAGVPLLVGAVLGSVPAAVNIGAFFSGMSATDQLRNAPAIVPWALVYVFAVTHLVVMTIRRGIRARELARNQPAREGSSAGNDTTVESQQVDRDSDSPARDTETHSIPKLPIAPNLFLGGAALLALFTIDIERRAWEMARSGELTQLEATGPVFSFFQFLDFTIGNFVAVIVIVFGLINWRRDPVVFRKLATPIVAAAALVIAPGSIALGLVGFTGLSGDATERNEKAQIGSAWINNLVESEIPEGFTEISDFLDCGAENCLDDPDSTVTFVRLDENPSVASDVCAAAITYAFATGANAWAIAPDYEAVPLESPEDPNANAMCVASLADYSLRNHTYTIESAVFRLTGEGDVPFHMDLTELDAGSEDVDPDVFNYRLTVTTDLQPDDLLPGEDHLSAGTHELNDLLTAIGQARLSNPDTDPNDATLIRDALDMYPHDIPVTPLVDSDGKIRFIEIQTSDEPQPMCVSIAPWNEEFEGMADPGTGYGVSSADSVTQLKENPYFGTQAWGSCSD